MLTSSTTNLKSQAPFLLLPLPPTCRPQLPTEIWLKILSFLQSPKDRCAVSLTSKSCYQLSKHLWSPLYRAFFVERTSNSSFSDVDRAKFADNIRQSGATELERQLDAPIENVKTFGNLLCAVSETSTGKTLDIWNLAGGSRIYSQPVQVFDLSTNGSQLYVVNKALLVFDIFTGNLIEQTTPKELQSSALQDLKIIDNHYLFALLNKKNCMIWDIFTGAHLRSLSLPIECNTVIRSLHLKDSLLIVEIPNSTLPTTSTIYVMDLANDNWFLLGIDIPAQYSVVSETHLFIITSHLLKIWDFQQRKWIYPVSFYLSEEQKIEKMEIAANYLCIRFSTGECTFFDMTNPLQPKLLFPPFDVKRKPLAYKIAQNYLYVLMKNNTIEIFDGQTFTSTTISPVFKQFGYLQLFKVFGDRVVTLSDNSTRIGVWCRQTGELLHMFKQSAVSPKMLIALTQDFLFSTSLHRKKNVVIVHVFDITTGKILLNMDTNQCGELRFCKLIGERLITVSQSKQTLIHVSDFGAALETNLVALKNAAGAISPNSSFDFKPTKFNLHFQQRFYDNFIYDIQVDPKTIYTKLQVEVCFEILIHAFQQKNWHKVTTTLTELKSIDEDCAQALSDFLEKDSSKESPYLTRAEIIEVIEEILDHPDSSNMQTDVCKDPALFWIANIFSDSESEDQYAKKLLHATQKFRDSYLHPIHSVQLANAVTETHN